ncbi:crotonobetaine/carnitine-CoA ligase [compost metagenome]
MTHYLGDFAAPQKAAVINAATGEQLSYRELDERSNRLAQFLYSSGLRRGDRVAVVLENHMRFFEIAWAALRSGLLLVAVNRYLTADECAAAVLRRWGVPGTALARWA